MIDKTNNDTTNHVNSIQHVESRSSAITTPENCCISLKKLIQLIAKIAVGILIIPWLFPSYRSWVVGAYRNFTVPFTEWRKRIGPFTYNPTLDVDNNARQAEAQSYRSRYLHEVASTAHTHIVRTKPLMGHINAVPGAFSQWMPGIALAAAYLIEKHKVSGLYVCETMESFSAKLKEIVQKGAEKRCAFVLPSFSSRQGEEKFGYKPNFPQHKITVVMENRDNELKFAILDADPLCDTITPSHLQCNQIWDNWDKTAAFFSPELTIRAMLKANLPQHTHIFYSGYRRERTYGCGVYALKDAMAFLRDPDFFKKLQAESSTQLENGWRLHRFLEFPPACMIGTQSTTELQKYLKRHPNRKDLMIPGKNNKSLQDYMDTHVITVDKQKQNHYITRKMFKYMEIVQQIFERFSSEEIEILLNKTLVT